MNTLNAQPYYLHLLEALLNISILFIQKYKKLKYLNTQILL